MRGRVLIFSLCMVILAVGPAFGGEKSELKTEKQRNSYAIGTDMGNSLKQNKIDVDADMLARGIKDAVTGAKPLMTQKEVRETIMALQKKLQAERQKKMKALAEKNKKEGDAFLAANKKKKGVKTLPSGLQYKVITKGKGVSPKATDTVTVNYRGTLIDGKEFDSSYKRGKPITFPVNGVIKGWTEALQMMKEGSKWELFIPPDLAYGPSGRPGIPPNSVLVFEVELIKVEPKK